MACCNKPSRHAGLAVDGIYRLRRWWQDNSDLYVYVWLCVYDLFLFFWLWRTRFQFRKQRKASKEGRCGFEGEYELKYHCILLLHGQTITTESTTDRDRNRRETYEDVRIELYGFLDCGHCWTAVLWKGVLATTVVVAAAVGLPSLPGHVLEWYC